MISASNGWRAQVRAGGDRAVAEERQAHKPYDGGAPRVDVDGGELRAPVVHRRLQSAE